MSEGGSFSEFPISKTLQKPIEKALGASGAVVEARFLQDREQNGNRDSKKRSSLGHVSLRRPDCPLKRSSRGYGAPLALSK